MARLQIPLSTLALLIFLIATIQTPVSAIKFNRNLTGVSFSAYVRHVTGDAPLPDWNDYTLDHVKTMVQVISKRFSRLTTFGVGAKEGQYQENFTYNQSFSQVFTAEAAALLNKEGNHHPPLTVLIGLWMSSINSQMNSEIMVALESAKRANNIYSGTAEGIVITQEQFPIASSPGFAKLALLTLRKIRNLEKDKASKLKLGTRQSCEDISLNPPSNDMEKDKLPFIRREIIEMSDFIICKIDGNENDLLRFQDQFQKINPNTEVMGQVNGYSAKTLNDTVGLKAYWEKIDNWTSTNNFTVWVCEAFDNPWKSSTLGWWKLKRDDLVGNIDGYQEKIYETLEPTKETDSGNSDIWTYIGIGIGLVISTIIVALLVLLYGKFNHLKDTLSQEEVKVFIYGKSDENEKIRADRESGESGEIEEVETVANTRPYDRSYEISKSDLEIEWGNILGSGEFGCVHKAMLSIPNEGIIKVALKRAKDGCPKNVVKSLLSEIKILIYLGKNSNIASIIGAYTAEIHKGVVYIAMELCDLGSLLSCLRHSDKIYSRNMNSYANIFRVESDGQNYENTETNVAFSEMVQWSYEIACGMEHLANKRVIHADLAARNVLLTSQKVAKITDFGLSRRLYEYANYQKNNQEPLPWRWMAVEALKRFSFSSQSDVWSYGITLWEIFAMGDIPYPGMAWTVDFANNLENGLRLRCPLRANEEIYKIMCDCWETEPQDRPTFSQLKWRFGQMTDSIKK